MLIKLPFILFATVSLCFSLTRSDQHTVPVKKNTRSSLYFGYYGTNLSETASYTNIYQASSITDAVNTYNNYKIPSLLLVYDTFFTSVPNHMILQTNYIDNWNSLVPDVIPLLENGTILGFNLGDELVWNCLAPSNLTIVANTIRNTFPRPGQETVMPSLSLVALDKKTSSSSSSSTASPTAFIWYNEAAVFRTHSFTDSCGNGVTDYYIPTALDWFSVDIYHMDGIVPNWVTTWVQGFYNQWIFPNITTEQSVILVPGSFGSDVNHYPNGTYICNRTCYDYMCSYDAHDFVTWANTDPRIVGIFPWNYAGCPSCNGSRFTPPHTCCMDELGTQIMNRTKQTWNDLFSGV